MKNIAIKTIEITKRFGKIEAVKNLNLEIHYGQIYGLLGPNGAGKTTLVRILNTLIRPTSGRAIVGGFDILTEKKKIRKDCGLLPEFGGLYQKLTGREFLFFIGELYNFSKKYLSSRVNELLKLFDLKSRENDLIEEYSKGMKQKLSICATLINDPNIIFLDEPTSNLDPASAKMIKDLIFKLSRKAGKTIFICTHLMGIVDELCDKIGIINKGNLLIEGTPYELLSRTNTNTLEAAYLKILKVKEKNNLLKWREN